MSWLERHFGGHLKIGPITIFGANAMHFQTDVKTWWGYICFRPTTYHFGRWWRWQFYISRDGTPCKPACRFAIGPGLKD